MTKEFKHKKKPYSERNHVPEFTLTNQLVGAKPVNRKKNSELRRKRPAPQHRINRGSYVWPKMSESKYNPDGTKKEK